MLSSAEIEMLITHGENEKLEFKEVVHLSPVGARAEFIRDILALVNSHGDRKGYMLIGVSKTGTIRDITDLDLRDENFQQSVNELVEPPIRFKFVETEFSNSKIGYLEVDHSLTRPHVVKKSLGAELPSGDIFIRYGSAKRRPTAWDYEEFFKSRSVAQRPRSDIKLSISQFSFDEAKRTGHRRMTDNEARHTSIPDGSPLPIVKEILLQFDLQNIGTIKATDVLIAFDVPDNACITYHNFGTPFSPQTADIFAKGKKDKIFFVKIPELVHHLPYKTETIRLIVWGDQFINLAYKLHEATLPQPIEGTLNFNWA